MVQSGRQESALVSTDPDLMDPQISILNVQFSWLSALCVSLYGLGSWIVVNGLWVELPVLVNVLPEGWDLPAYLSILIQIANIGPLIYVPLTRICRTSGRGFWAACFQPPERIANYIILTVGLLSCILLAHLWNVTVLLPGISDGLHSIGLLALALCAALVDCTSSVTFVAYLTGLPEAYMGALTFGEAFSDIVPSSFALIQGVGGDPICVNETVNGSTKLVPQFPPPRFSISIFMYLLALIMCLSLFAFTALDSMPWGLGHTIRRRYLTFALIRQSCSPAQPPVPPVSSSIENESEHRRRDEPMDNLAPVMVIRADFLSDRSTPVSEVIDENNIGVSMPVAPESLRNSDALPANSLLLPVFLLSYTSLLTYGLLPGFQSYSTAAYNSITYHLAAALSGLICALAAVFTTYMFHRAKKTDQSFTAIRGSFIKTSDLFENVNETSSCVIRSNLRKLHSTWILLTGLFSIPAGYVIYLAHTSPNPPQLHGAGPGLAILSWIVVRAGFGGLRTWLWLHLSSHSTEPMTVRLAGLATQMGSAIGAVISFLLLVYFRLFESKPFC